MKDTLLVTLADKNFIDQAKQLFSSVYFNAGWKGDYMLLAHEIPEKDLKWFRDKGILVKKCKPLYNRIIGNYSPILLDKFYLFTPEFKKWRNIVYLDADMIVRASLDRLANVNSFAAIPDMGAPKLKNQISIKESDKFLDNEKKFNLNSKMFNAGVIAFSTSLIMGDTFSELKNLSDKYIKISKFSEQLIWNLFFYKKWEELPYDYDIFPMLVIKYDKFDLKDIKAVILHFIGFIEFGYNNLRCWDKKNQFYSEWKRNLDRAELIDLEDIPKGKRISSFKILLDSLYLANKIDSKYKHLFRVFIYLNKILSYFKHLPDRIFGLIGQFIKKYNSNLYYKLKGKDKSFVKPL